MLFGAGRRERRAECVLVERRDLIDERDDAGSLGLHLLDLTHHGLTTVAGDQLARDRDRGIEVVVDREAERGQLAHRHRVARIGGEPQECVALASGAGEHVGIGGFDRVLDRAAQTLEPAAERRAQPDLRQVRFADAVDLRLDRVVGEPARHGERDDGGGGDRDDRDELEAQRRAHHSTSTTFTPVSATFVPT
jgi:hypothetical protein